MQCLTPDVPSLPAFRPPQRQKTSRTPTAHVLPSTRKQRLLLSDLFLNFMEIQKSIPSEPIQISVQRPFLFPMPLWAEFFPFSPLSTHTPSLSPTGAPSEYGLRGDEHITLPILKLALPKGLWEGTMPCALALLWLSTQKLLIAMSVWEQSENMVRLLNYSINL